MGEGVVMWFGPPFYPGKLTISVTLSYAKLTIFTALVFV